MHSCSLHLHFSDFTTRLAQSERSIKSQRAEADRFYEEEQYNLAIQYYRELADLDVKDVSVSYRLADCYMKTFNYPDAEAYYLKVYFCKRLHSIHCLYIIMH